MAEISEFTDDTKEIRGGGGYNDESAYRREILNLSTWCHNNLALNVSSSHELIVDFRKNRRAHGPVTTNSSPVVIKIPGRSAVRLPIWALNISSILKKDTAASVLAKETCTANLVSFYQSTIESVLTGCITV